MISEQNAHSTIFEASLEGVIALNFQKDWFNLIEKSKKEGNEWDIYQKSQTKLWGRVQGLFDLEVNENVKYAKIPSEKIQSLSGNFAVEK